jgi:hypothetical protein
MHQYTNQFTIDSTIKTMAYSQTILVFLQKIADATNAAAKEEKLAPHLLPVLISPIGSMQTLYRGHTDMPTELAA